MPLVYGELRRLAEHYMRREQTGHTLQPTALVHGAYLRLAGATNAQLGGEATPRASCRAGTRCFAARAFHTPPLERRRTLAYRPSWSCRPIGDIGAGRMVTGISRCSTMRSRSRRPFPREAPIRAVRAQEQTLGRFV